MKNMNKRIGVKGLSVVFCALCCVVAGSAWAAKEPMCVKDCAFQKKLCNERCKGDNSCMIRCSNQEYNCVSQCSDKK